MHEDVLALEVKRLARQALFRCLLLPPSFEHLLQSGSAALGRSSFAVRNFLVQI